MQSLPGVVTGSGGEGVGSGHSVGSGVIGHSVGSGVVGHSVGHSDGAVKIKKESNCVYSATRILECSVSQ